MLIYLMVALQMTFFHLIQSNKLYKKGSTIFNNEFFNKFTASFVKTFEYPEIKENKISESPQKSNIKQKKDNIIDNVN